MSKSTSALTRPLVKVFLDMVDTSLKFLVPSPSFCSTKLCIRMHIIRFMLSKTVPEVEHLEHCFCPLSIRLAIAGISITIPSILVADTCTHLKVSTMAYC